MEEDEVWTPPADAVIDSQTEPTSSWTPPEDAVVDEPVKKKESQGLGGIDFIQQQKKQFEQPGQPEVEPSKTSTPKSTGSNSWESASVTAEAIDPIFGKGLVDLARKVATGFADEIPQSAAQSKEVAKSFLKPASNAEYIQRVPVDFQNFVREKEGLKWYEAFEMSKYLDKYADEFMKETGRSETAKKIAENRPELVQSRLETERYVQQQKAESAEKMAGATQSYKDIKDVGDFASYIATLGANALYQIPLSVVTRGGSSLIQESATIYDQRLDRISQEKGISREEVIKQGLDAPAEGQAFALLAASLDKASALNIISAFKKGGGQIVKKWASSAIPEAVTEPTQGILEDIGSGASIKEAVTSGKRIDEAVGGLVGGSAGALNFGSKKDAINAAVTNTEATSIEQAEQAAEVIEKTLNTEENGLNVQPTSNTEGLSEVSETPKQQGTEGEGVEATGDVLSGSTEQSNNETTDGGNETPKEKAKREIDALVASGDVERDGNKVKILTERGGQEVKRIYEELEKSKAQPAEKSTEQSGQVTTDNNEESVDSSAVQESPSPATEQPAPPQQQDEQPSGSVEQVVPEKPDNTTATEPVAGDKDIPGGTEAVKAQTGSAVLDQPEEKRVSGIKKALVPEDKVDATPVERRNMEQMLSRAKEQVDAGEVNPKAITDEIAKGNARALQPDEVSALVYYKTQIDNRSDQLNQQLIEAIENNDSDAQARIRTELDAVNQEIDNYNTMAVKTAYEQSLAFNMRKMLLDNEYNLQSQINKYKAANNGKITPEVEKKFQELDKQLKDANARLKKMEDKQSMAMADESLAAIRASIQKQREKRIQTAQQRKAKINEFFDKIKVKSDPGKLNSITQVIGESVYNGSVEAIRAAVLAGADVASAIQAGIDYVKENYRGTDFDEQAYSSVLRPGLESIVPSEPSGIPEVVDGKLRIPPAIIRKTIEDGAENISQVVMMVKDMIRDAYPDISNREIRDAITAYGTTRSMSKDEIDVKIREVKRVGRLISQLEDVQNKQRPLRSGLQRDKPTDEERKLQRDIREGMKDIPVDPEEEARTWKNALDAIKSRLTNQIADLEKQIETGEKSPKKKGIEYDDEAKRLQERRDELRAIIQSMEGKPKISDEQRIRQAINATGKQITELERRLQDKDTSKQPRSAAPTNQELTDLRQKRDDLRKAYTEMEKELGVADARKLDAYKKAIKRSQEMYEQRLRDKDFVREKKKPLPLDAEATKLKLERDKIKQQFDLEQEKARLANRPLSQVIGDTILDVWNVPKSLKSTLDMSAPLRQGAVLSISNPKEGAAAFAEMFRQAFSGKRADEWLLLLRESPIYALIKQSKLYVAEPTTKLTAKEESFMSNIAERIPGLGKLVGASNRAYTGYLNKLRVDIFANGADRLRENGITPESNPEAYKAWANFVNNATGRGNLGGAEMAAPLLNTFLFAPKYLVSRVNLIANPVMYARLPKPVRIMALKNVLSWIAFNVLFMSMLQSAFEDEVEIEWDPRSSDFGKIRLGNIRFDLWAGEQQLVRTVAQIASGKTKNTNTGEITELDKDKFPNTTEFDVLLKFIRTKASPSVSTIWNVMEGENIVGEEVTLKSEVKNLTAPLYPMDMYDMYQEEGPTGLMLTALPAFFGAGVQNFSPKSSLSNEEIDTNSEIEKLNKSRNYTLSQPTKSALSESLDHDIDDVTMNQFMELRDKEIKRQFDRYKGRLEAEKDAQIYDKLMDQIVKEAGRHAKYKIAREKGWRETAKEFNPGEPFRLRNYKKNEDGKVVPR